MHVYRNSVVEWFVAESPSHVIDVARKFLAEHCGIAEEEMDLDFEQEPDDKALTMQLDDVPGGITKTCAEWARNEGPGFLGSTEW